MFTDLVKVWQSLDPADSYFSSASRKNALILSGLSSPGQSSLAVDQIKIAQQLTASGYFIPQRHFPFNKHVGSDNPTQPPLWQAAIANGHQYAVSLVSKRYAQEVARHLQPFFTASKQCVIITNSMGFQMLQVAQTYLEVPADCECVVVALGPVSSSRDELSFARTIVLKGHYDWVTDLFDSHQADCRISAHHLNYFSSDELVKVLTSYGIISP